MSFDNIHFAYPKLRQNRTTVFTETIRKQFSLQIYSIPTICVLSDSNKQDLKTQVKNQIMIFELAILLYSLLFARVTGEYT